MKAAAIKHSNTVQVSPKKRGSITVSNKPRGSVATASSGYDKADVNLRMAWELRRRHDDELFRGTKAKKMIQGKEA